MVVWSLVFFLWNTCVGRIPSSVTVPEQTASVLWFGCWVGLGKSVGRGGLFPSLEEVTASPINHLQERWRAVCGLGAGSCFLDFPGTATQQPTQMAVG